MPKTDDLLDAVLDLEQNFVQQGNSEGRVDGGRQGFEDARILGETRGRELGYEVGFQRGCVEVWQALSELHPSLFSDRQRARLAALRGLLGELALHDPQDQAVFDKLETCRSKFKGLISNLKLDAFFMKQGDEDNSNRQSGISF